MLPIISNKDKSFHISVFRQESSKGGKYFSVSLQRAYKRQDSEEWTYEKINMFKDDLTVLIELLRKTYYEILDIEEAKKAEKKKEAEKPKSEPMEDDTIPF